MPTTQTKTKESVMRTILLFVFFLSSIFFIIFIYQKIKGSDSLKTKGLGPFIRKTYNLSLKEKPVSLVKEIALFEDDEDWSGDGEFDYNFFIRGRSSLTLNSLFASKSKVVSDLKEEFKIVDFAYLRLFVEIKSPPENISELNIALSDKKTENVYRYKIGNLVQGWNFLTIPTKDFIITNEAETGSKPGSDVRIGKVVFELTSSLKGAASVNFDYLWAEKPDNYLDSWIVSSNNFLSLIKDGSSVSLFSNGVPGVAVLKEIDRLRDFAVRVNFNPIGGGAFGLLARGTLNGSGYYFLISRDGYNNYWQIVKLGDFGKGQQTLVLASGNIDRILVSNLQRYWLKLEAKGNNFRFYISSYDGNYIFLGGTKDNSFTSGRVGVVNINRSLFMVDEINLTGMSFE